MAEEKNMNFSSKEFLSSLFDRDSQAIELLLEAYHQKLYLAALKQGLSDDQAEEVTQSP